MFKKSGYLLLVLVFLVGTLGFVKAAQAAGGDGTAVLTATEDVVAAMRAAPRPSTDTVPALAMPKVPRNAVLSGGAADYSGKSDRGGGSLPDPDVLASLSTEDFVANPALEVLAGSMEPYAKALKYTDYPINYYAGINVQYPYLAIGRLWIWENGGWLGWCTASVIESGLIVTAAHCVYDTAINDWYDGWEFDPFVYGMGQSNPWTPDIYFGWSSARVNTRYQTAATWWAGRAYDIAMINLTTFSGQPVNFYTGTLGWEYGMGPARLQNIFGYPGNLQGGNAMWTCVGQSSASGKYWMKMGCPMEGGSSGGPWIDWFDNYIYYGSASNFVNGVVSGGVAGSYIINGTNFAWDNFGVLCTAEGFC